ncbi:NYN domain-containing protein [Duganella sp. S19_KUP01_CR8]|uniref:NYN domain-containing protein n=1 Tax=Duganella sp. S19_KUP01_CR8 TaxID=3025502 RepID=UPI002FCDD159
MGGFFTSKASKLVCTNKAPSGRTVAYVDGYNLYYGRLRGTRFKWLDIVKLFEALLVQRDQNETLEKVIFFTAPAFATHGTASVAAQSAYHRALKAIYGDRFEIVLGSHAYDKDGALLPVFIEGQPYDRTNRVRVWKLEEKKTDVNLAIRMYRDAARGRCNRMILMSNDSDAEPVLAAVRADFEEIMIGLVTPVHPPVPGTNIRRRTSGSLSKYSHWNVVHLTSAQLDDAQLPPTVPTKKKPIQKPLHW